MRFIDGIPFWAALLATLTLGLAPFAPVPHLIEKVQMVASGSPVRPVDIFDLFMHGAPWAVLLVKLVRFAAPVR